MSLFAFETEETKNISNLVEQANNAYDQGEPILTDHEFDLLADTGIQVDSRNFRKKVKHPFPMRSLSKIKTAETFAKWLSAEAGGLAVMPKLDGSSIRLTYREGKLVQAVTRG